MSAPPMSAPPAGPTGYGHPAAGQQGGRNPAMPAWPSSAFAPPSSAPPASGPPFGAPSSAPPASAPPASAPPFSAPPFSTPPATTGGYRGTQYGGQYGHPQSAPPATGHPQSAPPATGQPAGGAQYNQWARGQRPGGTVYGAGQVPATFNPASPLETSGSLTGHILAQGAPDTPPAKSRTTKVVIIMLVVLALVVMVGLLAGVFLRDTLTTMFDAFLSD
jgi:hypothetical protein